jgi:hypothetical protein
VPETSDLMPGLNCAPAFGNQQQPCLGNWDQDLHKQLSHPIHVFHPQDETSITDAVPRGSARSLPLARSLLARTVSPHPREPGLNDRSPRHPNSASVLCTLLPSYTSSSRRSPPTHQQKHGNHSGERHIVHHLNLTGSCLLFALHTPYFLIPVLGVLG